MKSGATETAYIYLSEHYQFPDNVFVSHLPEEIKKSNHPYKILWAHHAYDQPVFVNFDHHTVNHIVSPSQWNRDQLVKYHNVPEYKISVIPNGVSDIFSYSDKKTKTMIYTSIPYKGLEVLSKIIPRIHQVHPDTKFKIFSSMSLYGPSNDPFIELYDHLKKLPNVEYSAAVDQEELVSHYQEAAFFIHPNIWEETFCVSMVEAMKSGAYPIITDIGALTEVAGENNASVVPIDGNPTSKGYQVTEDFINNFTETCCKALDYFDKEQPYYYKVSKIISDYVSEKYNWSSISEQWKSLILTITGDTMATENTALTYTPIDAQRAVVDEEYLKLAFDNVLRWENSDREMAQGRTNFQLEKFIGLNTHNISVSFEHILKERRIMATGYMYKLIEMKEKVREFDYKWSNAEDKTKPFVWEFGGGGPGGGGKKLCWFDLDELELTHYLKSCELEIRDRLHQMEHLDKMLDKLIEQNGGKVPDREQFLEENQEYWDTRLAEQALDDLMAAQTGISGANLQAMRRASGPSMVDERNNFKEGYLSMNKLLDPQGRLEFINDLQGKVLKGYEKLTGTDLGYGTASPKIQPGQDKKQITGDFTEQ
jgi:glycosyltransferase involved in cell wall biosynthesis